MNVALELGLGDESVPVHQGQSAMCLDERRCLTQASHTLHVEQIHLLVLQEILRILHLHVLVVV